MIPIIPDSHYYSVGVQLVYEQDFSKAIPPFGLGSLLEPWSKLLKGG